MYGRQGLLVRSVISGKGRSSLPGTGEGNTFASGIPVTFTKGNVCPAFRQEEEG